VGSAAPNKQNVLGPHPGPLQSHPVGILGLLHDRLAFALVLYFLILGAWGLLAARGAGVSAAYLGALVIAEALAITEGVLGMALFTERPPSDAIHILYGVSVVLALPLAYTYARDRSARRQAATYGLTALFACGLALRGIGTS
jgi:hypothetical protein